MHKFGIRFPHSVDKGIKIDKLNGNTLLWDLIYKEMKNIWVVFKEFDGDLKDLIRYKKDSIGQIFDINMGENPRRKAHLVVNGHKTATPAAITYSSVESWDRAKIDSHIQCTKQTERSGL